MQSAMEEKPSLIAAAEYIESIVAEAKNGNVEAAHEILEDLVSTVDLTRSSSKHVKVNSIYARYLADCIRNLLDNPSAGGRAFNLKGRSSGRPRGTTTHDPMALAAAYWFLIRHGYRSGRAISQLIEKVGTDRRAIQRASNTYNILEKFPLDGLVHLMRRYAEKIELIISADSMK